MSEATSQVGGPFEGGSLGWWLVDERCGSAQDVLGGDPWRVSRLSNLLAAHEAELGTHKGTLDEVAVPTTESKRSFCARGKLRINLSPLLGRDRFRWRRKSGPTSVAEVGK